MPALPSRLVTAALGVVLLGLTAACSSAPLGPAEPAAAEDPPAVGSCYLLDAAAVAEPSHTGDPVDCSEPHSAETFAVGTLPESLGQDRDDPALGRWVYPRCQRAFERFLGVDESLAMRIQLSWAWFRPSEAAWDEGGRWYRCDAVGGPADAADYRALPESARGLFRAEPPLEWLTCARGETVAGSEKVPCSTEHDWRAVTTIKLGGPDDPYPGDRDVQVRTRDFCSDSVVAWLNYPPEYEFGYTWFREAEWQAGNRRSICWAKQP